ncbi:hypothetical protein J2852_005918 [Azospirillum soli]|nr:hypothetical protein [Azospirillum soli]
MTWRTRRQSGAHDVLCAVDVGVNAFHRVVFGSRHMLQRGGVDAKIDAAHGQFQPLAVADIADEVTQRRCPFWRHGLLHLILLELVAGEHDDAARFGVAHQRFHETPSEGPGAARHQDRVAVQHPQTGIEGVLHGEEAEPTVERLHRRFRPLIMTEEQSDLNRIL